MRMITRPAAVLSKKNALAAMRLVKRIEAGQILRRVAGPTSFLQAPSSRNNGWKNG
jgi:hypothetical protein